MAQIHTNEHYMNNMNNVGISGRNVTIYGIVLMLAINNKLIAL